MNPTTQARQLLKDWPHLAPVAAIAQIAAMLALSWTQAETLYKTVTGV